MAMTRQEINKKSREKHGLKTKAFTLDAETIALFEKLAEQTGMSQVQVLKAALVEYAANKQGIDK